MNALTQNLTEETLTLACFSFFLATSHISFQTYFLWKKKTTHETWVALIKIILKTKKKKKILVFLDSIAKPNTKTKNADCTKNIGKSKAYLLLLWFWYFTVGHVP